MTAEQQLVDAALRAWQFNADRAEKFFHALTDEQLQHEIAPGRNRLIYLWGHLAAVSDRLLALLGAGPRLHPELDATFLESADRATPITLTTAELKEISSEIDRALWAAISAWTPADWLARHTAVSEDDFAKEPHRNRLSVLLSRIAHTAFHYGQMTLTKPRGTEG